MLLAWITTPGSRWLVGIITTMPSTCRRVRCRVSSLATPFCPLTSVTSGEVCSATSRIDGCGLVALHGHDDGGVRVDVEVRQRRSGAERDDVLAVRGHQPQAARADRVEVRPAGDGLHVDTGQVEPGREHAADRTGAVHDDSHGRHSRNE